MSAATTLSRVRVIGGGLDAITARLRLQAALGGCDLRPPGLPPAALLLVRRVSAPPGVALPLEAGGVRPPPEWEAALVDALERALHSAARPARGSVPAGAEAVLFADRAELLACLARDALDGTVWARWWWRSALAAAGGQDPVERAWLAEPAHVPAALELLAAQGVAADVVRALPETAAAAIAEAVLRVFEVPAGRPARAAGDPSPSPRDPRPPRAAREPAPSRSEPAWHALVAEARTPALGREQRGLLAVALALRRAPARVRATGFVPAAAAEPPARPAESHPPAPDRALPEPVEPSDAPPPSMAGEVARAPARQPPPGEAVDLRHEAEPRAARVPAPPARPPVARAPGPAPPAAIGAEPRLRPEAAAGPAEIASPPAPAAPPANRTRARRRSARAAPPPSERPLVRLRPLAPERPEPAPVARPVEAPATTAPPGPDVAAEPLTRPVETELGGLFYLLNLALFLGLYGDFTRPREPGIALDPWDLVALLGEALLGDRPDDPVWAALARLAGREASEPPGRGFRAPIAWRVPREWLEPFEGSGTWRWSAAARVLRLQHPAGFPAVAVPRGGAPAALQLRRELRRLRCPAAPVRAKLPREPARPLERWVARLAPYCDARLRQALGTGDLAAVLLRRRARLFVTSTHVDVVFPLAEHPLEIRFAGLDRTPGFIPATGRTVALHFE